METLINYNFQSLDVQNPDGTRPAHVENCLMTTGPGDVFGFGNLPNAISFKNNGTVSVQVNKNEHDFKQFTMSCVFKLNTRITKRTNLFETSALPFAVTLNKTENPNQFMVSAHIKAKEHGWAGESTMHDTVLGYGVWYHLHVVYDIDTLGIFINKNLVSVHSFPNGELKPLTGNRMYIGTWVDGSKYQFKGDIAHISFCKGIPNSLKTKLNASRRLPVWFISNKYEAVKKDFNLGYRTDSVRYSSASRQTVQEYSRGLILYSNTHGAFEIHGLIKEKYLRLSTTQKRQLGLLVSDEIDGARNGTRKNLFTKGGIYWSPATGAHPLYGQIYLDYEDLGGGSHHIGLPTRSYNSITGGRYQLFQWGRMYLKNGSRKAHEVHGSILSRYLATGGHGKWGYPISDELDVKKGTSVKGKMSHFERCTFYWSNRTGAFEVHGSIRAKYDLEGGPTGGLGFPTSNESNIPGESGCKYNSFQNGTITWFKSWARTYACYPFKIYLDRITTRDADDDFIYKDDSEIYFYAKLYENGHQVLTKRRPNSGYWGNTTEANIRYTLPRTMVPNSANKKYKLRLDAWDDDDGRIGSSGDDSLGVYQKELNIRNAWGHRDGLVYNRSGGSRGMKLDWSVKPNVPQNNRSDRDYFFWGQPNRGTNHISWNTYADAFRDVTKGVNFFDHVSLKSAFYELFVESLASGGNCFGMSLEGIYAKKNQSRFSRPLNQYSWGKTKLEFNIKHQYQVGAAAIWWFVGQFLSGNTHDPKSVFNDSYNCAVRGDHPVICISQDYDFGGAPHCIYPHRWTKNGTVWKITCFDPNIVGGTRDLIVRENNNRFTYNNGRAYSGGEWSGGRFHYMPWRILNRAPRTPIWDAILLLLAGTVVIFGDAADTRKLTDKSGKNLNGGKLSRNDSTARRKKMFVPFKGFDGKVGNQMFFQQGQADGNNFIHELIGKKNKTLKYGVKNNTSEFSLKTSIKKSEIEKYDIQKLGSLNNKINILNSRAKAYTLESVQPTGVDGELIKYTISNVAKAKNAKLELSIKPNLQGIELVSNQSSRANMLIEVYDKNKKLKLKRNFEVPIENGLKFNPHSVLNGGLLQIGSIIKLGGSLNLFNTIKPK